MSACETETTVPGFLKRLANPSVTDSSVCCSETQCTKTFADAAVFERELSIYKKRLPYVPRLIAYDRAARTLTAERVGAPLGSVWTSGNPVLSALFASDRWKRNAHIRRLHRRFHRDTGLYHNDLCYKNVLRDERGRLYLVDFELADAVRTDADGDGILSRSNHHAVLIAVIVLVVIARIL